ncbi:MAG: hypothetical protein EB119_10270 [Synechococcaceae bacterium WBB_34_004]|nr:hypothetical protein [Synechococcaceae bacterium WBB_34_004]
MANAATTANPVISATGGDTNIGITLTPKGTGGVTTANCLAVGGATPSTSGAGITFPATQSASTDANTLDDYEEGTWTPSIGGTATYNTQQGSYTKIGRQVFVSAFLSVNLIGTGSATVVSGLPFTAAANNQGGMHFRYFNQIASNVVYLAGDDFGGATNFTIYSITAAGSAVGVNAILKNSAQISFWGVYNI